MRMPKFSVTSVWVRQLSSTSGRKTRNSSDIAGTAWFLHERYWLRRQDLICGAALLLIWLAVSIPRLNGPIDLRFGMPAPI